MLKCVEDGEEEDSVAEVGVSIEEGKRRRAVRKGSFCVGTASVGDLDVDGLIEVLRNLPDLDRDKCLRGLGRGCTVSEASEIGGVTHPNLIHAVYRLTQEGADEQPCG